MTRVDRLEPTFVEAIPEHLDPGTIYISIPYATVQHLCCCGCGNEVVTPLHPIHWVLAYDGDTVSLDPSVGNWSLPCKSHYVIRRNEVRWARGWSEEEIEAGRRRDHQAASAYFAEREDGVPHSARQEPPSQRGWLRGLLRRLSR